MRTSHFKWFAIFALALSTAACSPAEKTSFNGSGSSEENSSAPDTTGSPLYLYFQTRPEGASTTSSYETAGSCIVPSTDAVGTSLACDISVPELKLHYSDVKFVVGTTQPTTCSVVFFDPYYYLRSTAASFSDDNSSAAIDCSGTTTQPVARCYGGAAPAIYGSSFPNIGGSYFLTSNSLEESFTGKSANSLGIADTTGDTSLAGNIAYVNNRVDRTTVVSSPVHFAGNNLFYDYRVTCANDYGAAKYSIVLTISDNNGDDGDSFLDWDSF